jgi:GTP diphosphokinase / guanosine-3',5'-bis(diphosphate) 3'-diphosphatase
MAPTVVTPLNLQSLVANLTDLSPNDYSLIERAYYKAEVAHAGQLRKSGEPYFTHCVAVAGILSDMKLDAEAIAAALMHDTIEDTTVTLEEIRDEFGSTVAMLVDGVTKLKNLPMPSEKDNTGKKSSSIHRELEYIRKMLLTMGDDVRVVLIKLADRLHNMRTLGYMKPEKQKIIARETLDIFAPLANRLGIWKIKWELEDLSLRYLEPDTYRDIASKIDERRAEREAYMKMLQDTLQEELIRNGIPANVKGRPKHIFSIHKKMERKDVTFDLIYDVRALRVIVDNVPQCYQVLGVVHNLWKPIPGEFDDYIARPKDNFYQSLHTAVHDMNGKIVEVQIRTWEMHEHAEYGIAAHWRYKEGGSGRDEQFEKRISYLRRLMEFGPEVRDDAEAFMDTMKNEVFQDQIYVFTPKGDIIDLPLGATPIDFAYHVHTEIGHRCRGAKVNGKLVSLNHPLQTKDSVEIITINRGGPSLDWLNDDFGYVKTHRARSKIRQYFRKLNRDKHIQLGRETLEREMRRIGMGDSHSPEHVAHLLGYDSLDDFYAAVGVGDITTTQIDNRLLEEDRKQKRLQEEANTIKARPRYQPLVEDKSNGVKIMGTGGLLTNIATCCHPMPGDAIIGYVTRGRGVTVHRTDCRNIQNLPDAERLINVSWGGSSEEQRYVVPVEIIAYDRDGLLRDVSTVIADEKINITDVRVSTRQDIAIIRLALEITSNFQLLRVIDKIEQIKSVREAYRCNPS